VIDSFIARTKTAGLASDLTILLRLKESLTKDEIWLKERNNAFISQEIENSKTFFETFESHPLTLKQKRAIITDEANTLVIAGAGTGKTSTIIGKVGYLIKKGLAKPDEILLLSFNRKVAKEVENRLSKLNLGLAIKTYHGFGLEVVSESRTKTHCL
jgi:DNA helicase-4